MSVSTVQKNPSNGYHSSTMEQVDGQKLVDINHHFNGSTGWWKSYFYTNPTLRDVQRDAPFPLLPLYFHRDLLQRETWRPNDLLRYISPTYGKPSHILVQASHSDIQPPGAWRRRRVAGNAPVLMKLASWAIGYRSDRIDNIALVLAKSILVSPIILFVVAYPMGKAPNSNPTYPNFPGKCYEYPKHALNSLDAAPNQSERVMGVKEGQTDIEFTFQGEQKRLLRPRLLRVLNEGQWKTVEGDRDTRPYIFISFAAAQYYTIPDPLFGKPDNMRLDIDFLDSRAQALARSLGLTAYWADFHCRAPKQPEATDDVHRFCDVVRGAQRVCIVLPNQYEESLVFFGQRLWCLPEVLLARDHKVLLCTPNLDTLDSTELVDIMEFTHRAWCRRLTTPSGHIPGDVEEWRLDPSNYTPENVLESDGNEEIFRLLAENFTGTLTLSRLELIQVALSALKSRKYKEFQTGDIAYALMTLLTKRPRMDPTDSEQQALARLSLANDSDRIVERMACLSQAREEGKPGWFSTHDDLGANLWDVEPLCQVAGVCKDGSFILDGCHAISIRWKDIPRIYYDVRQTWKKTWAEIGLRSGPFWLLWGIVLTSIGVNGGGIFFLILGIILLILAPWSVMTLYGGKVWGAKPWLVGFEGTLPLDKIEYLTFGNSIGRFTYTPSSGPYCARRVDERIGRDPKENFGNLRVGERLFTLIDTGTMTVTVFAAKKPPSVALLCGKEGGMLRAVMCSYDRASNSLQKECVLRMETPMWDISSLKGWVKLG